MSTGRLVMITRAFVVVRWRATAEMRSTVEGSTHCRSSNTNSRGASWLSVVSASRISRNMRSRVAPRISCCNIWRCSRFSSAGNCTSQVGACAARISTTRFPGGPWHN